jgi:hypothetical protein
MSGQRKLNALLFELQTARNPLAQAKILARAWRTVRELSPTDRKLLARHVGFDGAEGMLEGLATRGGGWAPATLLKILSNARNTDGSSVSNLIDAIGDPNRREEAFGMGADLAADLLAEPEAEVEEGMEDVTGTVEEVAVPVGEADPSPEEALAALRAVEEASGEGEVHPEVVVPPGEEEVVEDVEAASVPVENAEIEELVERVLVAEPPPPPVIDWSRWEPQPAPQAAPPAAPTVSAADGPTLNVSTEPELNVLSRLRRLHTTLPDLVGSGTESLRALLEEFPQGWARRRALAALLEAGIPSAAHAAVELVAGLDRELDRRWCLGVLARRGDLSGDALRRAVDLLTSPAARRRLLATAEARTSPSGRCQ